MSERVWVVLDKRHRGEGYVEVPLLGTVAPTRAAAKSLYETRTPRDWATGGTYDEDQQNGWVRTVRATLTLEQPKSKSRRKR